MSELDNVVIILILAHIPLYFLWAGYSFAVGLHSGRQSAFFLSLNSGRSLMVSIRMTFGRKLNSACGSLDQLFYLRLN